MSMGNKKVRLGVAGLGNRGRHLMRLYASHPGCEVAAICDRAQSMVDRAAAELGNPDVKGYTSYERMVRETPLDALLIAINPDIQVEMACDAMNRGIHVTTEVPAAFTIKQCWDLVHTVQKTGVKYQLSEQTRYWGFIQDWKRMHQQGEFGHIVFAEGEYLHYHEWDYYIDPDSGERFYGSALPPQGKSAEPSWRYKCFQHPIFYLPHTLSPLLSILDDRVTRVSCMGTRAGSYYVPELPARDMEVALMHTDKDTVLRVAAGFTSPHGPRKETECHWYQVKGTKRTVEWARSRHDQPKMWSADAEPEQDWQDMDWSVKNSASDEFTRQSGHGGADWWPADSFIRAIREDTDVPMDVFKAVENAAPAILAAESSEEGGVLKEVPDFRKESPAQK